MIEKLKNYWADDELRPAGQLLAVFIVVSTALLWWCFPDGSLLASCSSQHCCAFHLHSHSTF